MSKILKPRRGSKSVMSTTKASTVLAAGEIFFESNGTIGASKNCGLKMGDGSTAYSDLPYFINGDIANVEITSIADKSSVTSITSCLSDVTTGETLGTVIGAMKQALSLTAQQFDDSVTDSIAKKVVTLNSSLTANSTPFRFGYDSSSNKYGYIINSGGADTVIPFNSGKIKRIRIGGSQDIPAAGQVVTRYINIPAEYQGKVTNDNIFAYMELVDCRNSYVYANVSGILSGNQVKVTISNGHSVGGGATINWRVDLVIAE